MSQIYWKHEENGLIFLILKALYILLTHNEVHKTYFLDFVAIEGKLYQIPIVTKFLKFFDGCFLFS
jgi:hypothetical protein